MSNKAEKSRLVPKLRFPKFWDAGEWEKKLLGGSIEEFREKSTVQDEFEVLTSARSGLVRQREYYDNDRITERDNIGFNIVPPNHLTYRSRSDDRRFYFNENDLGITGIVSTYYPVFRVLEGSNKFFVELLARYSTIVGKHSVGTSQTVLSLNELRRIKLPIPKESEQQKIAGCLTSLDELITLEAQRLDTLNTHKNGLMQQLFPAEGKTLPKLRFPEFRDAEEWEIKPLGMVCDVLNNRRKPITSSDRVSGAYPYYGASGIVDYVNDFIFDERLLLIGEDGAKWGSYENTAFIVEGKYWVNNHAHVLKPYGVKDTLLESYLTMLDLGPFVTGAAPPKLTLGKLKEIPVPVPSSADEQQKVADCLTSLDDLITAQAQKLAALKTHKKGLMQQLFPLLDEVQA
jgi:type I restriction enzyme, S subunit